MKILSLNKINYNKEQFRLNQNCKASRVNYTMPCDSVSFTSNFQFSAWKKFQKLFAEMYPNQKLEDVMSEIINSEKNKLGKGAKKVVYSIDGLDDYVLAHLWKKSAQNGAVFSPVIDKFPEYNFGQEIASNGADMIIMRKIIGDTHSIPDWTMKYRAFIRQGVDLTQHDADTFLSSLLKVTEFPDESYVDFARQIKYLDDRRIKIDLINPNNVMVDSVGKKITYFDLFEKPEMFHCLGDRLNSAQDMINVLADSLLQVEYFRLLPENKRAEMVDATKAIVEQCVTAAKKAGLTEDRTTAYRTYDYLQESLRQRDGRNTKYKELYSWFSDTYNNGQF